jgi:hypothetical protein
MKKKSDAPACCSVVELRQYTLHAGARETLIALFDGKLLVPQENACMHVIGQFRDLDDKRMFVWLRGFTDMPSRAESLETFYRGAVWREHRETANATMVDSDNVLLLRPAWAGAGLPHPSSPRPEAGTPAADAAQIHVIDIYPLTSAAGEEVLGACAGPVQDRLRAQGLVPKAWYATEESPNTFPALPVREGEHVVVSVSAVERGDEAGQPPADLLSKWLAGPVQRVRGRPTRASQLR